tara:strand:+ start:335 stop:529 length:195 start_codon:yes stop_codon:yes gene_type:complete
LEELGKLKGYLTYTYKVIEVCVNSFEIIFCSMAKSFWLVPNTVTNPAFAGNVEVFKPLVESIGG